MALRALMLRREIERKEAELAALREKDAEFETREADLEVSIAEAATEEENSAVDQAITDFEQERSAHTESVNALEENLRELRERLAAEEAKAPKQPEDKPAENKKEERSMTMNFSVRDLPMNQRVFEALPEAQRSAILQKDDVQSFLREMRSMKGQTRAISGGELTIPVDFLDLIAENIFRYSKLLRRVRVRNVSGEARQTIAGTVPEAVWTEMCGNLNELTFQFNQITLDGYKVGGYIPVCNALLEDNDVNLASFLVEMMSESLGYAIDKAILYGKGAGYHMPTGIVTRLAQQSQPENWPVNGPAWVDLHTTNLITIASNKTGAEFWAELQVAAGKCYTKYSRGEMFWAMNSKTFALLKSKAITFTASGDVVANVYGILPIVNGNIEGRNAIDIYKATVGKRRKDVEPKQKLPLKAALYVLKDKDEKINIELPVSGNTSDPEFNYMKIVWKTLGNLLVKVATSPARAIAGAVGMGGGELDFIELGPEQFGFTSEQYHALGELARLTATDSLLVLNMQLHGMDSVHNEVLNNHLRQYMAELGVPGSQLKVGVGEPCGRTGYSIASELKIEE